MITFGMHILFPQVYKQDKLRVNDDIDVYYQIKSDMQNTRWLIAVTTCNKAKGEVIQRQDLEFQSKEYSKCLDYIKSLPIIIINESPTEFERVDKFAEELSRLKLLAQRLAIEITELETKYLGRSI